MTRPATVPRYVEIAESVMWELAAKDIWQLSPRDRSRLILAALDAETSGTPEEAEGMIGIAVWDMWRSIRQERKRQRG